MTSEVMELLQRASIIRPMTNTLIDVGPSKLAYHKTGTGPDLVFVHGWPLHGATFRNIVPRLADRYTCHVFDLPGAGQSEWSSETRFTIEAHSQALGQAIEKLGLKSVGFVAHDSGAAIARLVAARLGQRCFGLVMGNTEIPAYHPPMLSMLALMGRLPGGAAMFRASVRSRMFLRSPLGFGGAFDDLGLLDGEFGELFLKPLASERVFKGQWGMVRDFDWSSIDNMEATHRSISAPVAFVWGRDDPWFPLERARAMVDHFNAGAEFVVLPGKVFMHEERALEFGNTARAFFDRVLGAHA